MTRAELVAVLEAEHRRAHDAITDAYWTFTRTARGAPPSSAVPWAYALRTEMTARLRLARRKEAAQDNGSRTLPSPSLIASEEEHTR